MPHPARPFILRFPLGSAKVKTPLPCPKSSGQLPILTVKMRHRKAPASGNAARVPCVEIKRAARAAENPFAALLPIVAVLVTQGIPHDVPQRLASNMLVLDEFHLKSDDCQDS